MTETHRHLMKMARVEAAGGKKPSVDYLLAVNGKKPRIAKAIARARVLGLIERALYGNAG